MPVYEYTALDGAGKNVHGIIDADSAVAARKKLRGSGIFPVQVKMTSSRPKDVPSSSVTISSIFQRVKPAELSATTRQLSILLGAGVTLVASLDALIAQIVNPLLKKIMAQVKESVNEGKSLAFSLSQHPKLFSQIYINMVRAGEASGSLDLVLDRLAEFSEHQDALRGRFKAALAYPVFMFFIGSIILFFLVTFIVPNITKIFSDMHQTLPLPSLVLIGVSNFLKSFWWLVLLVLAGCAILIKKLIKTPRGNHIWDEIKLRTPVIGAIYMKMAMARFGRTLGSLLQSGVPPLPALQIVRNIVNNTLIAEVIDNAMEEIEAGASLATSLAQSRWFPPIVIQMISVGEQSGELENMLDKVAEVYERETESKIMAMTSMLEPVMILVMGVVVGFIVISILLPIFEMNQMIR
ncbi:MAG: type II secretion system inner membrane protein GspF [Desulfobacterales bacterium]|nr:type II secretion system inner membrane protein GspF [Pseudomonadota bacterium]MCG2775148.1 type II secretion system inner membrane protein GspF [Desulfobacterales bacterium]